MPIITDKQALERIPQTVNYKQAVPAKATEGISWAETIGEAASVGTQYIRDIGKGAVYNATGINNIEPNFNAFEQDITGYEEEADDLLISRNLTEFNIKKQEIDKARERGEKWSQMTTGQTITAMLAGGLADPSSYIGLGFIKQGARLTENLARVAAPNVALVAGQEAIETRFDPTRDMEDAAINTAMAGLASLVLGGGAHGLAARKAMRESAEFTKTSKDLKNYLFDKNNNVHEETYPANYAVENKDDFLALSEAMVKEDSVGAAKAMDLDPEDYVKTLDARKIETAIKDINAFKKVGYDRVLALTSTSARWMQSNITGARELTEALLEIPYRLQKDSRVATEQAFETIMKARMGEVNVAEKRIMDIYKNYGKEVTDKGGKPLVYSRDSLKQIVNNKLLKKQQPETDFKTEVTKALRRNDEHPNPHIAAAAKEVRKVLDNVGGEAERLGVLVRGPVKTAESYAPRAWEKFQMLANRDDFVNRTVKALYNKKQNDIKKVAESASKLKEKVNENFRAQYEKKKEKAVAIRDSFNRTIDKIDELEKTKLDILVEGEGKTAAKKREALQKALAVKGEERDAKLAEITSAYDEKISEIEYQIEASKNAIKQLKAGKPKKPETLTDFVVKNGGLLDDNGEISRLGYKRVGFLRKENGVSVDDMALKAWNEGFFDQLERPELNQFLDALDAEVSGNAFTTRTKDLDSLNDWLSYDERFAGFDKEELKAEFIKEIEELQVQLKEQSRAVNKIIDKYANMEEIDVKRMNDELVEAQKQYKQKYDKLAQTISSDMKAANRKLNASLKELDGELDGIIRRRDGANKRIDKKAQKQADYIRSTMNKQDMEREANDVYEHILGLDENHLDFKIASYKSGATKERVLDWMQDADFEDYLVNDPFTLVQRYARQVGAMSVLQRKFGTASPAEIINAKIKREVNERVKTAKTTKEKESIIEEGNKATKEFQDIFDILLGKYDKGLYTGADNTWKKYGRGAIAFNFVRYMGGFVFSNLPDAVGVVRKMGIDGLYKNFIKPIKTASKAGNKMAIEDLKLANLVINGIISEKNASFADLGMRFGNRTAFDKFLQGATATFSKYAGIDLFNDTIQKIAGVASQNRIMRNIETVLDGSKLSTREATYMNTLGLDTKTIKRFESVKSKFSKDGDMRLANTETWGNVELVDLYRSALKKDVDTMYTQTGVGDKPLFANTALGQIVLQFRSFMFTMQTRVFLSSLQQRDAAAAQGLALMLGMGGLAYITKEMIAGREPDLTPQKLAFESVNRSGLFHIFMEANDIYEAAGGDYGLGKNLAGSAANRFYDRKLAGAVFGPSLAPFDDIEAFMQSERPEQKAKAMRRLVPYNNIFYVRWLMTQLDEDTQKALGYYDKPKN